MATIEDLQKEIEQIKERNRAVEANKAWETSFTRRGLLTLFTYLAISIYLYIINIPNPWLNAIVPTLGFLLSTLTLPYIKDFWVKHIYRKR